MDTKENHPFKDSDGRWWILDVRGGVKPARPPKPETPIWRRLPENKPIPRLLYQGLRDELL